MAKRDFIPLDIATQYAVKLIGKEIFFGETLNIIFGREISFRNITDFLKIKVNNLIIENKDLELVDNIPTNFNCDDIYSLGEIKFDLFKKIDEYIQELLEKI